MAIYSALDTDGQVPLHQGISSYSNDTHGIASLLS